MDLTAADSIRDGTWKTACNKIDRLIHYAQGQALVIPARQAQHQSQLLDPENRGRRGPEGCYVSPPRNGHFTSDGENGVNKSKTDTFTVDSIAARKWHSSTEHQKPVKGQKSESSGERLHGHMATQV